MDAAPFLTKILAVLIAAVLVVPVFVRLRLSAVLGYLVAGAAIGPAGLGLVDDPEAAQTLAEFGVVFLLFTLGLELSVERLRTMRRHIFGLGAAQVLATAAVVAAAALAYGAPPTTAAILGGGLAMSSTAVVLQILAERGELVDRVGRVSFAVLLFQDIAAAPLLAVTPLLAHGSAEALRLSTLAFEAGRALLAIGAILLIGRLLLRPVFRFAARSANHEVFIALALLVALGTGWATQAVGVSMALGAFLAGLLLAGTEYRHQVEADIEPYRGLLLGLFFMTVGMTVDPAVAFREADLIVLTVVLLITVKGGLTVALCRLFGLGWPLAIRVGLLLAQGGEFAFVVFRLAEEDGLVSGAVGQALTVAIALSMALTPLLAWAGARLGTALERRLADDPARLESEAAELTDHVVVAGFGRVGQTIARLLKSEGVPHLALDIDTGRVDAARAAGVPVHYGNAAQPEVLRRAGLGRARALVVTLDSPAAAGKVVAVLRREYPDLAIVVRAHDLEHWRELSRTGATTIVPETLEASLQLGRATLEAVGASGEAIGRAITAARAEHYALLSDIVPPAGADRIARRPGRGRSRWWRARQGRRQATTGQGRS